MDSVDRIGSDWGPAMFPWQRLKFSTSDKLWGYLLIAPFMAFFVVFFILPYGMVI